MAKHHMTVQVYRHRIRAIIDAMIIRGIDLAIQNNDSEMKKLYEYDGSDTYLENYIEWFDWKLIEYMLECECDNARLIFNRLYNRVLFKQIARYAINNHEIPDLRVRERFLMITKSEITEFERKIAAIEEISCDPDFIILNVVTINNPTYRSPASTISEDEIQVQLKSGHIQHLKEIYWSVMNLPNIANKQQYIEVYCPDDNWTHLKLKEKERYLNKLNKLVKKILLS